MNIRRLIIKRPKGEIDYSYLLEDIKINIRKRPIFIGTQGQWKKFIREFDLSENSKSNTNRRPK